MRSVDLSIMEIDELLEHLYKRLRAKKEGLSLVEPAVILLSFLKKKEHPAYLPHLTRFSPVIVDAIISHADKFLGYRGLESLSEVAKDIPLLSGDYRPEEIDDGLERISKRLGEIASTLKGVRRAAIDDDRISEKGPAGSEGFFCEHVWETAGLPLVSVYRTGSEPLAIGRIVWPLAELSINGEWSIRKKRKPVVAFEHMSAEPDSPFERQVHTAVAVAEEFAAGMTGMRSIFRLPRQYKISLPEIASLPASIKGIMTGESAGLAMTALLISVLGKLDLAKTRFFINPGTAFTGSIDRTGKILPVEDSLIREKVRTVFFSTCDRLVVPLGNNDTAIAELSALSAEWPSRRFDIIPVSCVSEACEDERIMRKVRVPAGKPSLQRIFHWRKHLAAGVSTAIVLYLLIFILPPYIDPAISNIELVDSLVVITDSTGRELTRYPLGFVVSKDNNACRRFFIDDFDGDGEDEAVCILAESRDSQSCSILKNQLHILTFNDRGSFEQQKTYNDIDYMRGYMDYTGRTPGHQLSLWSRPLVDSRGRFMILTGTHHSTAPPMSVINFSPYQDELQVFLHRGYLHDMSTGDFDGDGSIDLLFSGFHSGLEKAVMVVLDPGNIDGSSPGCDNYPIPGHETDIAKYYVSFPDFEHYTYLKNRYMRLATAIQESGGGFSVHVRSRGEDAAFYFEGGIECVRAEILHSFRKGKTKPDSIAAVVYDGKKADENRLLEGVRYWNGEDWVAEPSANKKYLEFIKRKSAAASGERS